jgi:hypothetical protein
VAGFSSTAFTWRPRAGAAGSSRIDGVVGAVSSTSTSPLRTTRPSPAPDGGETSKLQRSPRRRVPAGTSALPSSAANTWPSRSQRIRGAGGPSPGAASSQEARQLARRASARRGVAGASASAW